MKSLNDSPESSMTKSLLDHDDNNYEVDNDNDNCDEMMMMRPLSPSRNFKTSHNNNNNNNVLPPNTPPAIMSYYNPNNNNNKTQLKISSHYSTKRPSPTNQNSNQQQHYNSKHSSSILNFSKANIYDTCYYILLFLPFFVILPIYMSHQSYYYYHVEKNYQKSGFYFAGCFVSFTLPLSIREIGLHLLNWYMPDVQKYVVRILWMVPIYSLQSWLSLLHTTQTFMLYLEPLRDFYEAFVISSFLYYLISLLGGEEQLISILEYKDESFGQHPLTIIKFIAGGDWTMGYEFLWQCKCGVLIFVIIKLVTAIFMIILKPLGLYGDDDQHAFDPTRAYLYLSLLLNLSMSWAFYCLVKFFYATREELKPWKPIGKFLCIKGVVFFTFWQGFVILALQHFGLLDLLIGDDSWVDAKYVRGQLQALLVCVEMLAFALAHKYTFTHKEYCTYQNRGTTSSISGGDSIHHDNDSEMDKDVVSTLKSDDKIGNLPSDGYRAPMLKLKYLEKKMSIRSALWSVMPDEELNDVKRIGRSAVYGHKTKSSNKSEGMEMYMTSTTSNIH